MNSDAFNDQMKVEIREENDRAAREVLLKEQQQAYQESLLVSRGILETATEQHILFCNCS